MEGKACSGFGSTCGTIWRWAAWAWAREESTPAMKTQSKGHRADIQRNKEISKATKLIAKKLTREL